MKTTN